MPREKVEYSPNLPTIIELDGPGTPQANSRGETEYRYMLEQDRITWVPPAVHEQIVASGADYPGSAFRVTKHQSKRGSAITWEVERLGDSPRLQQQERAEAQGARDRRPAESTRYGYSTQPAPQHQPTTQAPPPLRSQPRPPQPAAQLAAQLPDDAHELPITAADRYAHALRDAIDLARGARQYAPEIEWNAGDVRAIATTLFIEQSKNGGRL